MDLICEHNLTAGELTKALRGIAEAEGVSEELEKALRRSSIDTIPKAPKHKAVRSIYEAMLSEFQQAATDIIGTVGLRKSTTPLTAEQMQTLTQTIIDRYGFIAAQMQSVDYVPDPVQLERWKRLGLVPEHVTRETFAASVPQEMHFIRNAFIMGRMTEAVDAGKSFEEVMRLALSMPLKAPDLAAIQIAEQQTARYITNNAADLATTVGQAWAKRQAETVRNMAIAYHKQQLQATVLDEEAKREAGEAIPERQVDTWQGFASELHQMMEDKARDWQRVAYYEIVDAQKQGAAHRLLEDGNVDKLVYKIPLPGACAQCRHLYLMPDGITPRLFKLSEMITNGTNIGRKPMPTKSGKVSPGGRPDGEETLKSVAGLVHPFCACGGPYRYTGHEPWARKERI